MKRLVVVQIPMFLAIAAVVVPFGGALLSPARPAWPRR